MIALFDRKSGGVSLRRSPGCDVDLSQLAQAFGGGGHPAASGCRPEELALMFSQSVAQLFSAKAQQTCIYKEQRFSDHAPLIIDYGYEMPPAKKRTAAKG